MENKIKCYCGHTDLCDCSPLEETLEETDERLFPFTKDDSENRIITIKRLFWIDGAKWQQERSYSEEEVIKIIYQLHLEMRTDKDFTFMKVDEWFEQFKKK